MKYLITGIEGFVGSYLLQEALEAGHSVYGTYFDKSTLTDAAKSECTIKEIDIRDSEKLRLLISEIRPDVIFHLAAQSSAALSWEKPQFTMDVNVNGTITLLECVRECSPKTRIVMIGSSEEYGIVKPENNPIDENHPLSPGNPYSISKVTCEDLCTLYIKAYNLDIVMTRSFNHIGIRQSTKFVISDFTKRIAEISTDKRTKDFVVGNLKAQRDFTDVKDVVKAYIIIAQKGVIGEIYNVGSGVTNSIEHYLNYMIEREGVDVNIIQDTSRMRPSDNPIICCDNTKLKKLGWDKKIDIYSTIDEMIDYWEKLNDEKLKEEI